MPEKNSRKRPASIVSVIGHLRVRVFSLKQPALAATTFSNSRGGRLRDLRLYMDCKLNLRRTTRPLQCLKPDPTTEMAF